jgi:hypothetical protein
LLDFIPVGTNTFPIVKVCGLKIFWNFEASQTAKPCSITADEMKDLVLNRPSRIVYMLGELSLREWGNIFIPDLAVFRKVILVEMAKGIGIHV